MIAYSNMHRSDGDFYARIHKNISVPGGYTGKLALKPIENEIDEDNLENNYISMLHKS